MKQRDEINNGLSKTGWPTFEATWLAASLTFLCIVIVVICKSDSSLESSQAVKISGTSKLAGIRMYMY